MSGIRDLADKLWTGEVSVDTHHPLGSGRGSLEEVADGVAWWHAFSNATAVATEAGLVLVDSGDPMFGPLLHEHTGAVAQEDR